MEHNNNNNNNKTVWTRTLIPIGLVALISWTGWVTLQVADYVGGEGRGERLSKIEAAGMIRDSNQDLRVERDKLIDAVEIRFSNRIQIISSLLETLIKLDADLVAVIKVQNALLIDEHQRRVGHSLR